jgi:hypothetical protein
LGESQSFSGEGQSFLGDEQSFLGEGQFLLGRGNKKTAKRLPEGKTFRRFVAHPTPCGGRTKSLRLQLSLPNLKG